MRSPARRSTTWIAVAAALAACGGGEEPVPPPKFTAAMVQGKTFYREQVTAPDQEKMLITFSSATAVTLWQEQVAGYAEVFATWSIDANGKLVLQAGLDRITVALVAEAATYIDVSADDGTGPEAARLFKTIPFGATLPDRFAVADRGLAGTTTTVGVAAFGSGTGVFTNGFDEESVTWVTGADGSIALSGAAEDNVLYLRADSSTSSPKSLKLVGRRYDAGTTTFTGIVDTVLSETPAKSGFTAGMVEGEVLYRQDTVAGNRSIIRYVAAGTREEWYEDAVSAQERLGTWRLTPLSGSLVALPAQGIPEVAAMLVADGPTRWDLLVNNGTSIAPASLEKTVAVTAAEWPAVWTVVERGVDGNPVATYPITLYANGTGLDPGGGTFTWVVQGDGSILVSLPGTETVTFYQRATSAPPNRFELAGVVATGAAYTGLLVQTYSK